MKMRMVCFQIRVLLQGDSAEVEIGCDTPPNSPNSTAALMAAIEHLMTMFAIQSSLPFDDALAKLVEGAKSNRVKSLGEQTKH